MTEPKPISSQTRKLRALIAYYADQGRSIEDLPALCGRTVSTLKRHARIAGASFSDYKPRIRNGP